MGDNVLGALQSRRHAVIDNWMIPFAAYAEAETPSDFQWVENNPKFLISRGGMSTLTQYMASLVHASHPQKRQFW